jgi:hypothetical protein
VTRVPWSLYDSRGNCLDVGTVEAESDSEALRAVLARPRSDLKPAQWYRVKAGSAVASAAGDEFANVGGQAGVGLDRAASSAADAMRAAETRRQAEGQLRDFLAEKVRRRRLDADVKTLGGVVAKVPPIADVVDPKKARDVLLTRHLPAGHVLRLDTVQITQRVAYDRHFRHFEARGACGMCGQQLAVPYVSNGYEPVDADMIADRLRSQMAGMPCSGGRRLVFDPYIRP